MEGLLGLLSLVLCVQVLHACTPSPLPASSIGITLSSHDSSYRPGDIHLQDCSQSEGRRYVGWCPDPHDQSPSVQIHLQNLKAVNAIKFQTTYTGCADDTHRYSMEAFLASFDLEYIIAGDPERNWNMYSQDLPALNGAGPERAYVFDEPLVTDSLRIRPKLHNIYPCFRFAILACEPTDLCPDNWCLHGGSCSGKNLCTCLQGYFGDRCNNSISSIVPENYDFLEIKDDKVETPDATFDIIGNVTMETYRKRNSHSSYHHGHAIHCQGHHSYIQYSSNQHHRRSSHHYSYHHSSHHHTCMSNLGHSSHGFTTSAKVSFGYHHDHHSSSCIFSNGGSLSGHQGASLHYHNNYLHFHVQSSSHHWHVSAPATLHGNQHRHHVQCSWHPHHGVSIHVNNHHIGSSSHAHPNSKPCTNSVPLRLCHDHSSNVNGIISIQISGLSIIAVSQTLLNIAGLAGPYTNPPPTTPTTPTTPIPSTVSTIAPTKVSATTSLSPSSSTTLTPSTITSGPHRPMCYSCNSQNSLGTCQTKVRCNVGEVCALFQDKTGYTSKCMGKQLCSSGKSLAGSACWQCCESYLCNDHCSASVNVTCADKSTCKTMMSTGYDVCKDAKMAVDICRKSCNKC